MAIYLILFYRFLELAFGFLFLLLPGYSFVSLPKPEIPD
jgi:hypothetical protein